MCDSSGAPNLGNTAPAAFSSFGPTNLSPAPSGFNTGGQSLGVNFSDFTHGSKDWKDKLKKFGQGAQGGIMDAFNQEPIQSAPFQFSPLTQPEPDMNGSPLTQSIIASLMQQMSGRQGG